MAGSELTAGLVPARAGLGAPHRHHHPYPNLGLRPSQRGRPRTPTPSPRSSRSGLAPPSALGQWTPEPENDASQPLRTIGPTMTDLPATDPHHDQAGDPVALRVIGTEDSTPLEFWVAVRQPHFLQLD